ncbi:glycosyltransferase family 4 protein [Kineococcus indalonis]|uniref:glycosyltransferase family 4 protein n=1 Tax=Kineococcus indalonis TaxID=2696566 RepID=UPI001412B1C3|nr:glycosyltransferase family 4 protein [Kineococcus indalonis]NAZ87051.1 glycosyltransferase [Kineococcus indalonis]
MSGSTAAAGTPAAQGTPASPGAPGAPLRVVYLDHCALLSGGEIALLRTLEALPDVERTVWLAEDGPLVEPLRAAGARVEVVPMAAAARTVARTEASRVPLAGAFAAARYTLALAARLRREAPDVVHTNSLKSALYGSLAGRLAGVPVVWHARDRVAADYMPARTAAVVRVLARVLPRAVVANSRATLDALALPAGARAAVVPDPYRPRRAPRERAGEGPLVFTMVGRLAPWKGQDVFLRAFAAALGGTGHRARVVGSAMFGEDGYAAGLHRLVEELGIAGQVELTGFSGDVEAVLAASDVLVHASTVPEPFGQVVVEGLAAGLPVVAADAGGPAEVVTDGEDGLLTPPGDVAALAGALRRLAGDAPLRERLGAAGARTAQRYRPEVVAPRFTELYRGLLSERRGARAAHRAG